MNNSPRIWSPAMRKVARELPSKLIALEQELHFVGLVSTAKKLNEAIQEIGYEIERIEEIKENRR